MYQRLEEAQKQGILTIDRAGYYDILFDRLLARRIDAVPRVRKVANYFLQQSYPQAIRDKIAHSETILEKRAYHLILNNNIPENKRYIELFNQGLQIIKANGDYDKLIEKLNNGYYHSDVKH